jgi:GT2 family glycosyltransferase
MRESKIPRVTIIIPNWNTRHWLPGCLDGLQAQTYRDFHILLVDNGSTDDSVVFVKTNYPYIEILAFDTNRGFAAAANAGIRCANSEYVVLLNVDTIPQPDWLKSLVEGIEHSAPDVGGIASKMLSLADPTIIDDAGNLLSWYGSACKRGLGESAEKYTESDEVFSISGGASLYRRSFFDRVGYFDEDFISYLEDVDLGLRGRLFGYRYLYDPKAKILHQWSGARIPRPRYVYLCTRNRLTLLAKNIPLRLLIKHLPTLLYGQLYFFIVYKMPFHSLRGMGTFLHDVPHILQQRKRIQTQKRISTPVLDTLLSKELFEPSLKEIVKNRLSRSKIGQNSYS